MESVKDEGYYNYERREMIEFIPVQARTVLDVGCGAGAFGMALKESRKAEVWGVEINEEAAHSAKERLDLVLTGDIGSIMSDLPYQFFDCAIFNDVLEHLIDPYHILSSMKAKLSRNGIIVCSLPNIRYYRQLKELLIDKQWQYKEAGILDKTHLRFFTEKSIIDMFRGLDFEILLMKGMNPTRSRNFKLLNMVLLGSLSDARYAKFVCVVKPK